MISSLCCIGADKGQGCDKIDKGCPHMHLKKIVRWGCIMNTTMKVCIVYICVCACVRACVRTRHDGTSIFHKNNSYKPLMTRVKIN